MASANASLSSLFSGIYLGADSLSNQTLKVVPKDKAGDESCSICLEALDQSESPESQSVFIGHTYKDLTAPGKSKEAQFHMFHFDCFMQLNEAAVTQGKTKVSCPNCKLDLNSELFPVPRSTQGLSMMKREYNLSRRLYTVCLRTSQAIQELEGKSRKTPDVQRRAQEEPYAEEFAKLVKEGGETREKVETWQKSSFTEFSEFSTKSDEEKIAFNALVELRLPEVSAIFDRVTHLRDELTQVGPLRAFSTSLAAEPE